jgi:hypothetical protein
VCKVEWIKSAAAQLHDAASAHLMQLPPTHPMYYEVMVHDSNCSFTALEIESFIIQEYTTYIQGANFNKIK